MMNRLKRWKPDWDWDMLYIFMIIGVLWIIGTAFILVRAYNQDDTKIELLAEYWHCTDSSTEIVAWGHTGTSPFPIYGNVCKEYSRK